MDYINVELKEHVGGYEQNPMNFEEIRLNCQFNPFWDHKRGKILLKLGYSTKF